MRGLAEQEQELETSLVVQWTGVCLPTQGHGFDPWSGKTTQAVEQLSPCTAAPEPVLQGLQAATA